MASRDQDVKSSPHTVKLDYPAPQPTASRSAIPPGTQIGEYLVERRVARGGMGAIYAARHPVLGRQAAIKVIHAELTGDPALLERFVREAQAVNLIRHPNIVDVFSIGVLPDGRAYFVMDWLDGASLAERLKGEPRMPLPEAAWILDETADAVATAHGAGVVHRDLKPANIFLARRGPLTQVKVLDFGIAKLSGVAREQTSTGVLMGTPAYLAPEQARTSQVDHRADIYALGVVAFEMLAGQRPFTGSSQESVVGKHVALEPPAIGQLVDDVPPALAGIVTAMMAKDPADRPTLDEVRRALGPYAVRPGSAARELTPDPARSAALLSPTIVSGPGPEAPGRARRRSWLLGALGAAAAVAAIAAAIALLGRSESEAALEVLDATAMPDEVAAARPAAVSDAAPRAPAAPLPDAAPAATIVISVDDDDARIEVDGKFIAEATRQVTVTVDPGDHEVVVTPRGRAPERRLVRAGSGATLAVDLQVAGDRTAARARSRPRRPAGDDQRGDPQERVRALHEATGKLADQLVAARKDATARQLQAEYLAIPSPYTTNDPDRLRAIEAQLTRIRARVRAARP